MSWPCIPIKSIRLTEWQGRIRNMLYTLSDGREITFMDLPPGAMWHSSIQPNHHGEPTICVKLPGNVIWRMNHLGSGGCRWNVSGEIPNVTATPSINYVGIYHGWVTNGVVTDDCEGRKFDAIGKQI